MNADETLPISNEFILKAEEKSVLHGFFSLLYRVDQRRSNSIPNASLDNSEEINPNKLDDKTCKEQTKNLRSKKRNGS